MIRDRRDTDVSLSMRDNLHHLPDRFGYGRNRPIVVHEPTDPERLTITVDVFRLVRALTAVLTFGTGVTCMGAALFAVHAFGWDQGFGMAGIVTGYVVTLIGVWIGGIKEL